MDQTVVPARTDSVDIRKREPASESLGGSSARDLRAIDSTKLAVMFSIPGFQTSKPDIDSQSRSSQAGHDSKTSQGKSSTVVDIKLPASNVLQSTIQGARQRFIDLAGGSLFWRTFVGSGVAVLIGAITVVLLGPAAQPASEKSETSAFGDQAGALPGDANFTRRGATEAGPPTVQLTVGTVENGGPQPAEFDDPFTAENQVPAKIVNAVHFVDRTQGEAGSVIQQVSQQRPVSGQPAWLSGTIEAVEDPVQPMRKHERTRPSHR